jgi:hypothetical protein
MEPLALSCAIRFMVIEHVSMKKELEIYYTALT